MRPNLLAFIVLGAALIACGKKENLPPLDKKDTDQLVESGIPGIYITKVNVNEMIDTSNAAFHCARACADIKKYFQYVVYPYTICTPPDFVVNDEIMAMAKKEQQDSILVLLRDEKPYTHVITDDARFKGYNRLFCRTVGGPWGAFLEDREFCGFCGDGPHQFTLTIPGLSHNLAWTWVGQWEDKPEGAPDFNRDDQSLSGVVTQDCNLSDHTNCGGSTGPGGVIQ